MRLGPILSCAILSVLPARALASPLSELAESLEPGEWAELTTEGLEAAVTEGAPGTAMGSILPYSEDACWDPISGQLFFLGSDHIYDGLTSSARFIAYSDDENRWRVMPQPPWIEAGTQHGYDHGAMLGGRYYRSSVFGADLMHSYDPASDTWTDHATERDAGYNVFGALEPFPERDTLVLVSGGMVWEYTPASDSWERIANGVPMGEYHNMAEYNPVHGHVLFGGGNGSGQIHVLAPDGSHSPRASAPFQLRVNDAVVTVDPVSGQYLAFGGGGELWTYDEPADAWTFVSDDVPLETDVIDEQPFILTVAAPVASYGVVVFVTHRTIDRAGGGDAEVWVYKHRASDPPGRPDAGPTTHARDGGSGGSDAGGGGSDAGTSARDGGGGASIDAGIEAHIEGGCAISRRGSTAAGCVFFALAALLWRRRTA